MRWVTVMKSTMQYLVLGLALAGVPLLAEAEQTPDTDLSRLNEASADHQHLLHAQQQLTLISIEETGQQPVLKLRRDDGKMLKVQALQQAVPPVTLAYGTQISVESEAHGWSLMHSDQLLAFVPNQYGQDLLHYSG